MRIDGSRIQMNTRIGISKQMIQRLFQIYTQFNENPWDDNIHHLIMNKPETFQNMEMEVTKSGKQGKKTKAGNKTFQASAL